MAGLNPYAAQAVLSEFKAPPDSDGVVNSRLGAAAQYGLAAFVGMQAEERLLRLEGIMCGRKLLQRVSHLFNAGWNFAEPRKRDGK